MNPASTIALDPAIFERNLNALREFQPNLAEQLTTASTWSESYTLETTRDGRWNFRSLSEGRAWFGRTSIPFVRAEAILQQFQSGTANVLLPGIAEGTEVELLLQRLGRHRAVYVWEPNLSAVQLVLCLHDFSAAIRDGRLIFLVCTCEQLSQTLSTWLDEHPGHLAPDRILMWPWQSLAELVPCRAVLESAYQAVEQRRKKFLDEMREHTKPPLDQDKAQVAILGLHARDEIWALADGLAAGVAALGWEGTICDVRTPSDVHPLARARKLAGNSFDWAVLLDVTRRDLNTILPEIVPAVSWLSTRATLDTGLNQAIGKHDYFAVTSSWLLDRAIATGLDRKRISICPPPCLVRPLSPTASREFDVTVMADLGPTDAESFGHRLPTHVQIWNTAVDLLQARIESFTDAQAEEVLARAEEKARVRLDDATLRRNTLDALVLGVGQTLLWRFLVQGLLTQKIRVSVVGTGWASVPGVEVLNQPRTWATRRQLAAQSKLVLEADTTGFRTVEALLAAGMGAVVLWRQTPRDTHLGGLATLLKPGEEMSLFSNARELIQRVQTLLIAESARQLIANRAMERCRSEHSPASRLESLKSLLGSASQPDSNQT